MSCVVVTRIFTQFDLKRRDRGGEQRGDIILNHSEGGQKKTQSAENKDTAMHQLLKTYLQMKDWISFAF